MSKHPIHNFDKQFLSDCKKAIIWSFRFTASVSRPLFFTILGCFILEAIIPVSVTGSIGVLVQKLRPLSSADTIEIKTLVFWVGLTIGLLALEFILTEVKNFSKQRVVDETGVVLQKRTYEHAAKMDLVFFENSDSLNRLYRATSSNSGATGPMLCSLSSAAGLFQIVSLFGLMLYLQPLLAIILFIAGIPLLIIRSHAAIDKYNLDVRVTQRRRLSRYYSQLLSSEENIPAIKLMGLASEIIDRFEQTAQFIVRERRTILRRISIRLSTCVLFFMCVLAVVIGWITFDFIQGSLAAGALAAFLLAAFRALKSHAQIASALSSGAESALSVIPLLDFLETSPYIPESKGLSPISISGNITLDKVSFTYPHAGRPVIKDFSLAIPAGQKVAIVGGNGAGKTTLIKLIARLYELDSGTIKIDDNDIRALSLEWLHGHIAMVFQKPTKFEASVYENIAFGDWKKLRDRPEHVRKVAEKMGLEEFINQLPKGYDTHLGRLFGDITLSMGQWQKLAVTRALAREDAVLILDEPSSSLDADSEMTMFRAIREIAEKRTVIFVSHKFPTVKEADRILVLEDGRLVEDGNHDELMASGGYYADMVRHQTGLEVEK